MEIFQGQLYCSNSSRVVIFCQFQLPNEISANWENQPGNFLKLSFKITLRWKICVAFLVNCTNSSTDSFIWEVGIDCGQILKFAFLLSSHQQARKESNILNIAKKKRRQLQLTLDKLKSDGEKTIIGIKHENFSVQ